VHIAKRKAEGQALLSSIRNPQCFGLAQHKSEIRKIVVLRHVKNYFVENINRSSSPISGTEKAT
jgi:hypothetical protein